MRSLNREGTLTAISFSPKNNLLANKNPNQFVSSPRPSIRCVFEISKWHKETGQRVPVVLQHFRKPRAVVRVKAFTAHVHILQASGKPTRGHFYCSWPEQHAHRITQAGITESSREPSQVLPRFTSSGFCMAWTLQSITRAFHRFSLYFIWRKKSNCTVR